MRITLTIGDDVLAAAKSLAVREHKTVGEVISDLARQALRHEATGAVRNGIPLLPQRKDARLVTPELVKQFSDDPVVVTRPRKVKDHPFFGSRLLSK